MDRAELERLDRESLVARAQAAGIARARLLTRPELVDELLRLDPVLDARSLKKNRGFFGIARDLLSKVVERGLHLPDAADRLRVALGNQLPQVPRPEPQAVPTVTLAEIYAAQGHKQRALETLLRVLEAEPEHGAARHLLERLESLDYIPPKPPLPPESDEPRDEIGAHLGTASAEGEEAQTETGDAMAAPVEAPSVEVPVEAAPVEAAPVEAASVEAASVEAAPFVGTLEDDVSELELTTVRLPTSATSAPLFVPSSVTPELECVALPLSAGRTYVWWRLSSEVKHAASRGPFVVRVLVLVPTWDGPRRETRDIPMAADVGELLVEDLPSGAVVRVAIGTGEADAFVPLAHSPALELCASQGLVRWTPEGSCPVAESDPLAKTIARATEAASITFAG